MTASSCLDFLLLLVTLAVAHNQSIISTLTILEGGLGNFEEGSHCDTQCPIEKMPRA